MKRIKLFIFILLCFFIFNGKVNALEDGVYKIHSAINDNYVIDVNGAVAQNYTNVQLFYSSNSLAQKFEVKKMSDGYYQITSVINNEYSLDANGARFSNFVNIQLFKKNSSSAQKWIIKEDSNGYYKIYSFDEKFCIDANGGVAQNYVNIQLFKSNESNAQKFRFEKIADFNESIKTGVYTISSAINDDLVIDVYNSNFKNQANVQLSKNNNQNISQKFYVTYLNNGYYSIQSYSDIAFSLDVHRSGKINETNVELFETNNGDNQKWLLKKNNDGYYNIISKCNYLALDVYRGFNSSGTNIQMFELHNSNGQKFKFNEVDNIGTKTIEDGSYFINTINSKSKVVDANAGVMNDGTNVQIFDLIGSIAQKWDIKYLDNGYYSILCSKNNNYSLQVSGNNINIGKYKNNDDQQWIIRKNKNGYFIISKSGKYLDLPHANLTNKTNIQSFEFTGSNAQKFNFTKTMKGTGERTLSDGIYRISTALNNNMFVDVNGGRKDDRTNIQLWSSNSSLAQKFMIKYYEDGYYKIVSLVDLNKSIDVNGASTNSGANAQIFSYSGDINQQWIIKATNDGYYNIISNCGDLYLDIFRGETNNGSNVQLWENNGGNNQKFKFIKSEKETRVIDVSYHQGQIDWNKVYNSGIYGVMLRIGYWNTEDGRLSEYINEVKRLGIPYGIYIFSYANTTNGANIEANFTKSIISKYNLNPTLGIYYDLEDWYISADNTSNSLSKDQYDNIARTYINSVSGYVGSKYKVKVYADLNHVNNRFGSYARSESDWIAHYDVSECGYKGPHSLWQYTFSGTIDGIRGYVDLNYLY